MQTACVFCATSTPQTLPLLRKPQCRVHRALPIAIEDEYFTLTRRDVIRAQEGRVPAKGHLHFEFEVSDDTRVSEVDMLNDVHVFGREEGVTKLCTVLVLVRPMR